MPVDLWYILQIILDIYLCGFVIFYIVSYRKKEFALLKKHRLREEAETQKINATLKDFLKDSEKVSFGMIEAFQKEHQSIKQSINYINLKIEELNSASVETSKLLNSFKEKIPNEDVRGKQQQLRYQEAANLLSKGFTPAIVAEKMNIPIGEIQLISKINTGAHRAQTI